VLWPPDGLNLKQGTCGQLWGYGYHPLPLIDAKATTAGKNVPTGGNCWTLFLNAGNFKGPVAFFTPYFFSSITADDPELAGLFLDTRPALPNRPNQMETQHVPAVQATTRDGVTYARVAPTSFPRNAENASPVMHQITAYTSGALHDRVAEWLTGQGQPAESGFDPDHAVVHDVVRENRASWSICQPGVRREDRIPIDWSNIATARPLDDQTFGYHWNEVFVERRDGEPGPLMTLPEYFMLDESGDSPRWVPVDAASVPPGLGLREHELPVAFTEAIVPYETPDHPESCWKSPGPVSGPHKAYPGDGSTVVYHWYRFADQPALLNADLSDDEREALQQRAEKLHAHWTPGDQYVAPPRFGELAQIDPALLVTPPDGLEAGYVPIVTWQGIEK